MKMRSRRQIERDRARRDARRRSPRTETVDDVEDEDRDRLDDVTTRTLLGYDD